MTRYCAACRERMAANAHWRVLNGRVFHSTGSCERLYQRRLAAAYKEVSA